MTAPSELHVRVNPDNRRIRITDPGYIADWASNFARIRAENEARMLESVRSGELKVTIPADDPSQQTPEQVVHFQAHVAAEDAMQRWGILGAIGLVGVAGGYDHGQTIIYHDDPSVPLYGHEIMETAPEGI